MPRKGDMSTEEAAYEEAVSFLARKARTTAEVMERLSAAGARDEVVSSVVGRLKAHRHLDDTAYASDAASGLLDGKGLSPDAAVATLVSRGVGDSTAREAVEAAREGRSEVELCRAAADRRIGAGPLAPAAFGRHARALARLGWDEETLRRVLEPRMSPEEA